MAISKERKTELVTQYAEQLKESTGVILTDYRGLSVSEVDEIRGKMRPLDAKFQVIKNRLLLLALQAADMSLPEEWLTGPTAISFCQGDVPPVAKVLSDAAKDLETLKIKGGLMGADLMQTQQVQAIADLPPHDVLMSHILGTINMPAGQIAGIVASGIRQVLNVLQAYADKLEESGAAPATSLEQAAEPA